MEIFDIVVIGSGPGGYVSAIYAARSGKKVALIEKDLLGGTCLNTGCIPTKTLLSSVKTLNQIRNASSFGIDVASYTINPEKINGRVSEVVKRLRQGIEGLLKARKVTILNGSAKISGPDTIDISGKSIRADNIIIATGARPRELPDLKFNQEDIISSNDIWDLKEIPKSLIIVGAGAIGCEFSVIYNGLGAEVSLIEMADEILPGMDTEISKKLKITLGKKGINIFTGCRIDKLEKHPGKLTTILSSGARVSGAKVLVCTGRQPVSEALGCEKAGIQTLNGKVIVDTYMRTSVPTIYAIGDVTGNFQLAHVASYEGIIACENILGKNKKADYSAVPNCIYTDPEIASVGLTEEAAKRSGLKIKIARFPYSALGKAHTINKTEGFIKLIGEEGTGKILGAHIIGEEAGSIISEVVLAIKNNITIPELIHTIHAHPTFSEGLMEACHIFEGKGIHSL